MYLDVLCGIFVHYNKDIIPNINSAIKDGHLLRLWLKELRCVELLWTFKANFRHILIGLLDAAEFVDLELSGRQENGKVMCSECVLAASLGPVIRLKIEDMIDLKDIESLKSRERMTPYLAARKR